MRLAYPARLLRIHLSEADRFGGKPLYEEIVAECRKQQIAVATVFRGLEGFGESAELHHLQRAVRDQPIVITIVDTADHLARLIPVVEAMMDTGTIAISDADVVRIQI